MARPKKHNIPASKVQELAEFGCTNTEIAQFFGCSESTIRRNYDENLIKGRASGKTRLRQLQWAVAEKGNVTMLIWLGKHMLGQSENPLVLEDELVEGFDLEVL
jgi:transcription initiation factor TFIIIB Brf1 subunit/transcription initiation factor TFIIB